MRLLLCKTGVRNEYKDGVDNFYQNRGDSYQNEHMEIVLSLINNDIDFYKSKSVLDLCCGNGDVTSFLEGHIGSIEGSDPYLYSKYIESTGRSCLRLSFKDLAMGKLNKKYDIIICSFALHLCDRSMLANVLYNLKQCSDNLVIITPNKKPNIDIFWNLESEVMLNRVRYRKYT